MDEIPLRSRTVSWITATKDNLSAPGPQEQGHTTTEGKIGNNPAVAASSGSAKPLAKNPTIRKSTQKTLKVVDTTAKKQKRKKGGNQLVSYVAPTADAIM